MGNDDVHNSSHDHDHGVHHSGRGVHILYDVHDVPHGVPRDAQHKNHRGLHVHHSGSDVHHGSRGGGDHNHNHHDGNARILGLLGILRIYEVDITPTY